MVILLFLIDPILIWLPGYKLNFPLDARKKRHDMDVLLPAGVTLSGSVAVV